MLPKILTFLFMLTFSNLVYANEVNWVKLELDEWVSLEFPQNYEEMEILDHKVYVAEFDNQFLFTNILTSESSNNTSIDKLKEGYDKFCKGFFEKMKNSTIHSNEFIYVDSLLCKKVVFNGEFKGDNMNGELLLVSIKDNLYYFYNMVDKDFENSSLNLESIINTIDFNGANMDDQLTDPHIRQGRILGKLLFYLFMGIIGIFVIRAIRS